MNEQAWTASNRDTLLSEWKKTNAERVKFIASERVLRDQVIAAFSEITNEMHSGMETLDLGWGHELKIEHKLDYKLDNANDNEALIKALERIETEIEAGKLLAARLVKWKAEISVSEYKKLPPEAKVIIDGVLTIKPATKAIELKEKPGANKG